jgi:hypothetical protein
VIFHYEFGKDNRDFILVLYSNHTSIMHLLRSAQVLPLAGNDVMVLSPLGGAASDFYANVLRALH